MEAPEYLDLDEIDFSDDAVYSVSSLKNIPELSRRNDGANEERAVPVINWSRGAPSVLPDVHSKFRPVKRVSPLKHQPDDDQEPGHHGNKDPGHHGDSPKNAPQTPPSSDKAPPPPENKQRPSVAPHGLFGELEHYDLDMDEILDVPYIKSSPMSTTLPRVPQEKRSAVGCSVSAAGTLERNQRKTHSESLSLSSTQTPFCVLSPVKWSDLRKSRSVDPDLHLLQQRPGPSGASGASGAFTPTDGLCSGLLSCSSSLSSFSDAGAHSEKLLSARVFPDVQRAAAEAGGSSLMFTQGGLTSTRPESKAWPSAPELDEESKRIQNILNTVREGQVSLLPHLAADDLEQVRDDRDNNLLHVAASRGHAQVLQHLTSLMGEDGLNERNDEQLTPAGLAVKNGHLECVRWMVSETEAIAELSCTRDFPSLIHYAAQHGQEKVLLWLLQFMQEQAISLDEVDPNGNTAVHTAAQHGHLTCIQTLVEYGSNVTVQNQQGERASQSAEKHGHTSCARYLVVVETCMSLASQVVKLTKQLNEQALERMNLQKQLQRIMEQNKSDGAPCRSPGSHHAPVEAWPELLLTAEVNPGDGAWTVRQSRDGPEAAGPRERLPPAGPPPPGSTHPGPRRAPLTLSRFRHIAPRSLSESDSEPTNGDSTNYGVQTEEVRPRPSHLPLLPPEDQEVPEHLTLMLKKHLPHSHSIPHGLSSSSEQRKSAFTLRESKSVDSYTALSDLAPPPTDPNDDVAKAATTSPKSALKSPSSRRKPSQNLKLRVTFDEQMIHKNSCSAASGQQEEPGKTHKRSFGSFRSIMETLSGNTNHSNNNNSANNAGGAANQNSPARKGGSPGAKGKTRSSNV